MGINYSERQTDGCGGHCDLAKSVGSKSVIFPVLQITALAAIALYLVRCRAQVHRRNRQSWDALLARLSPGWSVCVINESVYAEPLRLLTIYRDARVMQEIADYAYRKFDAVDRALVESLHRDATRVRSWALAALARYAFGGLV
jgi:hypothetical protein